MEETTLLRFGLLVDMVKRVVVIPGEVEGKILLSIYSKHQILQFTLRHQGYQTNLKGHYKVRGNK